MILLLSLVVGVVGCSRSGCCEFYIGRLYVLFVVCVFDCPFFLHLQLRFETNTHWHRAANASEHGHGLMHRLPRKASVVQTPELWTLVGVIKAGAPVVNCQTVLRACQQRCLDFTVDAHAFAST